MHYWISCALFFWGFSFFISGKSLAQQEIPLEKIPETSTPRLKSKKTADAVNFILTGTREQVILAFMEAGWKRADALGIRSSTREVLSTVRKKSYATAPVSTQYLFHKKQDLAFEIEEGNARKRHHVRLWVTPDYPEIWVGAATEDIGILIQPAKGVISHRVNPWVDLERDFLIKSLSSGCVENVTITHTRQRQISRLNAQGVRYFTDGELAILNVEKCSAGSGADGTQGDP